MTIFKAARGTTIWLATGNDILDGAVGQDDLRVASAGTSFSAVRDG